MCSISVVGTRNRSAWSALSCMNREYRHSAHLRYSVSCCVSCWMSCGEQTVKALVGRKRGTGSVPGSWKQPPVQLRRKRPSALADLSTSKPRSTVSAFDAFGCT
jgi:hypothetical protein